MEWDFFEAAGLLPQLSYEGQRVLKSLFAVHWQLLNKIKESPLDLLVRPAAIAPRDGSSPLDAPPGDRGARGADRPTRRTAGGVARRLIARPAGAARRAAACLASPRASPRWRGLPTAALEFVSRRLGGLQANQPQQFQRIRRRRDAAVQPVVERHLLPPVLFDERFGEVNGLSQGAERR